jgi:hypothetical protein
MSDTPRTDKAAWREHQQSVVDADFARKLERELAQRTAERDEARREVCVSVAELLYHDQPDEMTSAFRARKIAAERGWDCFKEVKP